MKFGSLMEIVYLFLFVGMFLAFLVFVFLWSAVSADVLDVFTGKYWKDMFSSGEKGLPSKTYPSVSTGSYHNCGVRPDGSVECSGRDTYGQASPPGGTFASVTVGH